jgi:hypothetical protein
MSDTHKHTHAQTHTCTQIARENSQTMQLLYDKESMRYVQRSDNET